MSLENRYLIFKLTCIKKTWHIINVNVIYSWAYGKIIQPIKIELNIIYTMVIIVCINGYMGHNTPQIHVFFHGLVISTFADRPIKQRFLKRILACHRLLNPPSQYQWRRLRSARNRTCSSPATS